MKTSIAIVISALIISMSIIFGLTRAGISQDANARPRGPFTIASGQQSVAWIVDQSTGRVAFCIRTSGSLDKAVIQRQNSAPVCSAWSE